MNTIKNILPAVLISLAIVIAGSFINDSLRYYWQSKLELEQEKLLMEAVDGCSKIATGRWIDRNTGAEIIEPYKPAYEKCLKDKGY